jgi:hypothetical protein
MVTVVPTEPLLGEKPLIVGAGGRGLTVKFCGLAAVPPGLPTAIGPEVASTGMTARRLVSDSTVYEVAAPFTVTSVAVVKPVPVTVTVIPPSPLVGLIAETDGGGTTVKRTALVTAPAGAVRVTGPVMAPTGTLAVTWVSDTTVKVVAATPPKLTAVAPVRPMPSMVTVVFSGPLAGVRPVISAWVPATGGGGGLPTAGGSAGGQASTVASPLKMFSDGST